MAKRQTDKRCLDLLLEAIRAGLGHLRDYNAKLQMRNEPAPDGMGRMYNGSRRLMDYLMHCAGQSEEEQTIDLSESDGNLLASSLAFRLADVENYLETAKSGSEENRWLLERRDLLIYLARELLNKPLELLPSPDLMSLETPGVVGLQRYRPSVLKEVHPLRVENVRRTSPENDELASAQKRGMDPASIPEVADSAPRDPLDYYGMRVGLPGDERKDAEDGDAESSQTASAEGSERREIGSSAADSPDESASNGGSAARTPVYSDLHAQLAEFEDGGSHATAADEQQGREAQPSVDVESAPAVPAPTYHRTEAPQIAEPEEEALLFDVAKLKDYKLRTVIQQELVELQQAKRVQNNRLSILHLGLLFEGILLDHALSRRSELGLVERPTAWDYVGLAQTLLGAEMVPAQDAMLKKLIHFGKFLRPSSLMLDPVVVTEAMVMQAEAFLEWVLTELGYREVEEIFEAPDGASDPMPEAPNLSGLWRGTSRS